MTTSTIRRVWKRELDGLSRLNPPAHNPLSLSPQRQKKPDGLGWVRLTKRMSFGAVILDGPCEQLLDHTTLLGGRQHNLRAAAFVTLGPGKQRG